MMKQTSYTRWVSFVMSVILQCHNCHYTLDIKRKINFNSFLSKLFFSINYLIKKISFGNLKEKYLFIYLFLKRKAIIKGFGETVNWRFRFDMKRMFWLELSETKFLLKLRQFYERLAQSVCLLERLGGRGMR